MCSAEVTFFVQTTPTFQRKLPFQVYSNSKNNELSLKGSFNQLFFSRKTKQKRLNESIRSNIKQGGFRNRSVHRTSERVKSVCGKRWLNLKTLKKKSTSPKHVIGGLSLLHNTCANASLTLCKMCFEISDWRSAINNPVLHS